MSRCTFERGCGCGVGLGSAGDHPRPASSVPMATVAPSNRITVGMIGLGRQCLAYNLPFFVKQPDCEVVALCDVDRWRTRT